MKRGKSEPGKTKKYSGLASNVKSSSAKKEAPQAPIPRIAMDRIHKIYDEYGFSRPNASHVQESLPNDEKKMRKILDSHRKVLDAEEDSKSAKKISDIKYHTELHKQNQKNHLDSMKAAAKYAKDSHKAMKDGGMTGGATGGPGMPPGGMPMGMPPAPPSPQPMGQAIPDQSMPQEMAAPPGMQPGQTPLDISNSKEAFFVGDFALIKLVNPGVQNDKSPIWLADVKNKVLRPFMSLKAFDAYFGSSQDAYDAIVTLPTSAISEDGPLADFHMMKNDFGVKDDGKMRKLDYSPAMISRRYGKPVDEAGENKAVLALDGLLKGLTSGGVGSPPQGGVPPAMPPQGGIM